MKKILLSLAIIFAVGAIVIGATSSFFSDTEQSNGNTFTAGDIDLKIDSQASYNGKAYAAGTWGQEGDGIDITNQKFFDFADIKPEDQGENTISIHAGSNNAWVCAKIDVTSDEDVTCTEPEKDIDTTCTPSTTNAFNGEIGKNLSLAWWADDGDNVLESNEVSTLFFLSGAKLNDLLKSGGSDNKSLYLTLADASDNFFTKTANTPLEGDKTYYVGLAWCFGDMDINGTDITCNGESVNHEAQTDSLTADMSFMAVQARNNDNFQCEDTYRSPIAR